MKSWNGLSDSKSTMSGLVCEAVVGDTVMIKVVVLKGIEDEEVEDGFEGDTYISMGGVVGR